LPDRQLADSDLRPVGRRLRALASMAVDVDAAVVGPVADAIAAAAAAAAGAACITAAVSGGELCNSPGCVLAAVTTALRPGLCGDGELWDTVPLAGKAAITAAAAADVIDTVVSAANRGAGCGGLGDVEVREAGAALLDTAAATGATPTAVCLNVLGGGLGVKPLPPQLLRLRALEQAFSTLAAHSRG